MAIPDFVVIGAQKAGTTWLYECLSEHPEVFVPRMKEVHFFTRPQDDRLSRLDQGVEWYQSLFPDSGKVNGELTPDYMFFPYVAPAIATLNPKMKIVALLRHPVDRAYSQYWMRRRYRDSLPFEDAIRESPGLIERGFYYRQLAPYLEIFGADRVRIYIYEEITQAPEPFFVDLCKFLGVSADFAPLSLHQRVGETKVMSPLAGFLFYKVASPIINLPGILHAWRFVRRRTRIKEWLFGNAAKSGAGSSYEDVAPTLRSKLNTQFEAENRRLFELLGRDVPAWKS
jgi:hypothetical protein